MGDSSRSLGLNSILAAWHRRKWVAIIPFSVVLAGTATFTAVMPNTYQATATVLVVDQQVPVDFVRSTVTGALDMRLQTISQDILSRSRVEELINRFGLYPNARRQLSRDALLERVRRDIEVKPKRLDQVGGANPGSAANAGAFTISYQGADRTTVAPVTNALASYYIEANIKVRERQAQGTAQFLKAQLESVRDRLAEQERRVSDFKRSHLGELPQQMEANLSTLERLNTQFRLNTDKQILTREQRQELARLLDSMAVLAVAPTQPATSVQAAPPPPDAATVRLDKLRQDLADLRLRFSDKYPDVIRLKGTIALLERQAAEAKKERPPVAPALADTRPGPSTPTPDPYVVQTQQALIQLDSEIRALKEEEGNLRATMGMYQARVENIPRRDLEFQTLSRDYDTTKDLYRTLLKRYEEAQLAESLEQRQKGEQFRILEHAIPPSAPIAPNRLRLLLVDVVLSLGLAVGLVVLTEQLDSSFHTMDDLRAAFTTFPTVGSIPRIVTAADLRRRRRRTQFAAAAAVFSLIVVVSAVYFVASGNEQLLRLLTPSHS